nr:THUMP domain-containing protein [Candidatus Njordarchaeota archaeon]
MDFPIVLVRFGEIALKSKRTRATLRRMLRQNISTKLNVDRLSVSRIEDTWERLILHTDESEMVADALSKVFGVISTSPAAECKAEINDIVGTVCDLAEEKLRQKNTFAVRVRRVGKHEFTSNQVARIVGSSIIETLKNKIEISVDLDSPDQEFFIEIRQDRCFVYDTVIRGVGGLPFGSQGKVVSRLNDYDSIIATWLMMKRGCAPILVVFNSNKENKELIDLTASTLLLYSVGDLPVIEMPLSKMIEKTDFLGFKEHLETLALNEIALLEGAKGIVTSERLDPSENDQVGIFRTNSSLVDFPIFCPLVGFDHDFMKHLAERIGGEKLASKIGVSRQKGTVVHAAKVRPLKDPEMKEYREIIRKMVVESQRSSLFT